MRTPATTERDWAARRASGVAMIAPATVTPHSLRVNNMGGMVLQNSVTCDVRGSTGEVRMCGLRRAVLRGTCDVLEAGNWKLLLTSFTHLSYSPIVRRWKMRASHR